MGSFTIDGRTFSGRSISIINGKVTIDGVAQDGNVHGVVEIRIVEGVVENLRSDAEVHCGDVTGDVTAGMGVTCGDVKGNVRAGMQVSCDTVGGSVSAGMGVSMRK